MKLLLSNVLHELHAITEVDEFISENAVREPRHIWPQRSSISLCSKVGSFHTMSTTQYLYANIFLTRFI